MTQDNNFIVLHGQLWANFHYLISLGIHPRTINNGISKNKNGKSLSWEMKKNGIFRFINLDTIPKYCYKKFKLEKEVEKYEASIGQNSTKQIPFEIARFKIAANSKWTLYSIYYQQFQPNQSLIQSLSKSHAVFEEIIQLLDYNKYSIKEIYEFYKKIPVEVKLYYRANSYSTFVKKIKQLRIDGIENVLPHKLLNKPSNSKKFTEYWKDMALKLYADPMKYTKSYIHDKVNHERHLMDLDYLSYQTIQAYLNTIEVKNITTKSRHGRRKYRDILVPHLSLTSESSNEIWQIDGFKIPFLCLQSDNSITSYDAVIVTDFYSRKIVGYSIGENENSSMIINAVENAIRTSAVLPCQIIHDNFSANFHKDVNKLKEKMTFFSTVWNKTNSDSPREKGNIERTIGTLNTSHFREIKGYTGEGIKTTREYSLPSPERLIEFRRKKNCFSLLEIISIMKKCVSDYNDKSVKGKPSPNSFYDQSLSSNSKKHFSILKDYHVPFLFYSSSKHKVIKSTITMHKGTKEYNYVLPSELRNSLNTQRVKVYFNYDNRGEIFVFSLNNECEFITKLTLDIKIPRNIERRTPEEIEFVKKSKVENTKYTKENNLLLKRAEELHSDKNKSLDLSLLVEGVDDKSIVKKAKLNNILKKKTGNKLNVIVKNINDIKI